MNNINFAKILFVALAMLLAPVTYAAKADKVDVIVVYDAKPGQAEKDRVKGLGGETKREFRNFNMRVISISENALKSLENGKGVKFVAPDRETFGMAYLMAIAPVETSQSAAHMTANMPAMGSINAGYDGTGVGIAIIDSGVGSHIDLNASIKQYDFLNGADPQPAIVDDAIDEIEIAARRKRFARAGDDHCID